MQQGRALRYPEEQIERELARRALTSGRERKAGRRRTYRRRKRVRPRHAVALPGETGAEVTLPSVSVPRPGMRLLSLLLLAATLLGARETLISEKFMVGEALVIGANLLSAYQVRSIAQVDDIPVFMVDPQEVETRLEGQPEIASAEVLVDWPNQVRIRLEERNPRVVWEDAGRSWWLSEDGVAFLERGALSGLVEVVSTEPVLNITQDPLEAAIDQGTLQTAIELVAKLPDGTVLNYDEGQGYWIEDRRGTKVIFGEEGDMNVKVRLYESIADWLEDEGLKASFISLENVAAPYYRFAR